MKKFTSAVVLIFLFILVPMPAHAYLDPGSGSALIQGILGAVAAIGVALKLYWHRVLKFLGLRKSKDEVGAQTSQKEQGSQTRS
jgi:hypothetical protein